MKGIPVGRYYCHCRACQKAHSSPYVAFALFSNDAIKWTSGQSSLLKIDGLDEPQSETHRYTCGDCGTRLYKEEDNAISLCVAIFDNPRGLPKEYEPTMHYFYKEKVRSVRDGNWRNERNSQTHNFDYVVFCVFFFF